jgi:hypothetical protein
VWVGNPPQPYLQWRLKAKYARRNRTRTQKKIWRIYRLRQVLIKENRNQPMALGAAFIGDKSLLTAALKRYQSLLVREQFLLSKRISNFGAKS